MDILQPPGWPRPKGYSNGISASGRMIFTGGLVGWDENENFPEKDMAGQARRTFENIIAVLKEGSAGPEHIVRMTWYITDRDAYLGSVKDIGQAYRDVIGRHFPAMAVVQVVALMEADALMEIEVTAVVPE
ncbi:MAG: RidA family protein [Rhodospirillaceae bacterium]|jgi:enamine deaminase RidA (YjgF/YER057c/UK114 family)